MPLQLYVAIIVVMVGKTNTFYMKICNSSQGHGFDSYMRSGGGDDNTIKVIIEMTLMLMLRDDRHDSLEGFASGLTLAMYWRYRWL